MDIVHIKDEFKNSGILLVILGALLILVTHSVDSLLAGLHKIFGLSIKSVLILSIYFHGVVLACLLCLLYWTISKRKSEQAKIFLSLRTLKSWGITLFLILLSGAALSIYMKLYYDKTLDISQFDREGLTIHDLANLATTQSGLITLRNVLLFIIYFAIVFRRK